MSDASANCWRFELYCGVANQKYCPFRSTPMHGGTVVRLSDQQLTGFYAILWSGRIARPDIHRSITGGSPRRQCLYPVKQQLDRGWRQFVCLRPTAGDYFLGGRRLCIVVHNISALCDGQVSVLVLSFPFSPTPLQQVVAVLCSGNALVSINAVALHRARLVLGWVTAFG